MLGDLYLLDLEDRQVRALLRQPGPNVRPRWSPDGRHIAFVTQGGRADYSLVKKLGVIELASLKVSYPAAAALEESAGGLGEHFWGSDGRSVYLTQGIRMRRDICKIDIANGSLQRLAGDDLRYRANLRLSRDGQWLMFTEAGFDRPNDLYVSPTSRFRPVRVTEVNRSLRLPEVSVKRISWRSADGRWDIPALFIKQPSAAKPPLVVAIMGGPGSIELGYGLGHMGIYHPLHAFIARGYAVLVPQTRGRSGYGGAFRRAIAAERSFGDGPVEDILSGVDYVVAQGLADESKMALVGGSYGGYLTSLAMTRTNRFRAVGIAEGVSVDTLSYLFGIAADPYMTAVVRGSSGHGSPYVPEEFEAIRNQSPLYGMRNARTPALLEYGMEAFGGGDQRDGRKLFHGLKYFNVPVEFIRYPRTGHGWMEPQVRLDSALRNLEWFDYWVLGRATPRMKDRYGDPVNKPGLLPAVAN